MYGTVARQGIFYFNQGEMMDKMELIKDNLAKIDKAIDKVIEAAVFAEDGLLLRSLMIQRSGFVIDACSMIDRDAAQAGERSQCGDKAVMEEINCQRTLNLAIEKARKKTEVRREELPAAIPGKHLEGVALTPCPNDSSQDDYLTTKVGSIWCRAICPHFVESKGYVVYCRYPEKSR